MRMVPRVKIVMVQCTVQPVIKKFGWSRMEHQQLPHAFAIEEREIAVTEVGEVMHECCSVKLKNEEVVPMVLPIDLFVLYSIGLYPCMLRQSVESRQTDENLGDQITDHRDDHHMPSPVIPIIVSSRHCNHKWCEKEILERSHSRPRPLIQCSWVGSHSNPRGNLCEYQTIGAASLTQMICKEEEGQ